MSAEQRQPSPALAPASCRGTSAFSLVGLAVEHPLERPQQVDRGEDHAGGGDDRPPAAGEERAEQERNSPTKPVKPGRPIDANITSDEDAAEDRRRPSAGR